MAAAAHFHTVVAALLLTVFSAAAQASDDTPLLPSRATYETDMGAMSASGERVISPAEAPLWRIENDASVLFLTFEEGATAAVSGHRVVPVSYRYKNPVSSRKSMRLVFDWEGMLVTQAGFEPHWELPLNGRVYDKLSYQLQLRLDAIRHGADYPPSDYAVIIKRGKIGTYHVEYQGEETLETALGSLRTAVFEISRRDRLTRVWLAADWNYLLVQSLQTEADQDDYSLKLADAEVDGRPVTSRKP